MNIGMVAPYPPIGEMHSAGKGGVASYTKNLAVSIARDDKVDLTVFADKLSRTVEQYTENDVTVVRCWGHGVLYVFGVLREVFKRRRELDLIHLQHEYFLYGNVVSAVLFPFMLLLLTFMRKPVVVTLHGVISLSGLDETFRKENNLGGNPVILRFGLRIITKLISSCADIVVTHEYHLREIMIGEYHVKESKVVVIPHGVEENSDLIPSQEAKETLGVVGRRVVMFFGYISGYKGLHILLDAFKGLRTNDYVLVVAGGEHPRLQGLQKYESYMGSLREKASDVSNEVRFVGFVPNEEVPLYFCATDVVVLPYTTLMSSSGPFALCIAYRRPFLLSESFGTVVSDGDLLFDSNAEALRDKIEEFFSDGGLEEKSLACRELLFQQRSWGRVGCELANLYRGMLHKEAAA